MATLAPAEDCAPEPAALQDWPLRWMARERASRLAERSGAAGSNPDSADSSRIEQARQGDETAARALVQRLYPLVLKIVRGRLSPRTLEEDLTQAIFAKIFKSLHQFSGRVPLEHWVSRIAINTCINQLKHESGRPELRMSDLSQEQEAVVEHLACTDEDVPAGQLRAARELLERLMAPLWPEDRMIINLLHLEERSVDEISRMTGWSISLVKVRAFRAREKMRRLWKALVKEGQWESP